MHKPSFHSICGGGGVERSSVFAPANKILAFVIRPARKLPRMKKGMITGPVHHSVLSLHGYSEHVEHL